MVNAVSDSAYLGASPDSVQTQGCAGGTFTCVAEIHGSGSMTLTVSLFGRRLSGSAATATRYYCPLQLPTGTVGIAHGEPVVLQAKETQLCNGGPTRASTRLFERSFYANW